MALRSMLHKHPRSGYYYFRKRVPKDCIESLGRKEVVFSLHTKDRKEADKRVVKAEAEFNELIEKARQRGFASLEERKKAVETLQWYKLLPDNVTDIDRPEIARLIEKVAAELNEAVEMSLSPECPRQILNPYSQTVMNHTQHVHMLKYLLHQLKLYDWMFFEKGFKPSLIKSRMGHLLISPAEREKIEAILGLRHVPEITATIDKMLSPKKQPSTTAPKLSAALDKWKAKEGQNETTLTEWTLAVRRFIELHDDLPIDQITDEHVVQFREAVQQLPARLPPKIQKLPLPQILEMAKAGQFEGKGLITANTVRKQITALHSIFAAMIKDKVVSYNPASGKMPKKNKSKRRPFRLDELNALFHSPLYAADYTRQPEQDKTARYWLPLIGLFTGARASEIGQALVTDIVEDEGFWYLNINDYSDDKSVKEVVSKRKVPLHNILIKCGLVEYVNQVRKSGQDKVFTGTSDFSAWFGKYCDTLGLEDPLTVFHSFRHSFVEQCREAEIDLEIRNMLVGHTSMKTMGEEHYNAISLRKRNDHLQRVRYPGLNLSHLYYSKDSSAPNSARKKKRLKLRRNAAVPA